MDAVAHADAAGPSSAIVYESRRLPVAADAGDTDAPQPSCVSAPQTGSSRRDERRPMRRFGPPVCRSCGRPGHVEKNCFGLRRQIVVEKSLFIRERAKLQNAQEYARMAATPAPSLAAGASREREREREEPSVAKVFRVVKKVEKRHAASMGGECGEDGAALGGIQLLGQYDDSDDDDDVK